MAAKAKADMDDMERRLSEAEATLSPSTSSGSASAAILSAAGEGASSLRSFVKPLLFVRDSIHDVEKVLLSPANSIQMQNAFFLIFRFVTNHCHLLALALQSTYVLFCLLSSPS